MSSQSHGLHLGFIGLGVMGAPMARHLADAGHSLSVYDSNPDACARLAAHPSVTVADSPRAVASASQIVITMLPSGREVRQVVLGDGGLLEGFEAGDLLLDTSSSEPWLTREVAARLAAARVAMVDAPVSGAEAGAIAAELVFMVGGETAAVRRVEPLLRTLGKQVFHLGGIGAGHVMKSVNNLITAMTFMATAEGLLIGAAHGLDPATMTAVLNESTGMSWISRTHIAQRILTRRFDDPFKLDLMVKDIGIALRSAADRHIEAPLAQSARQRWQAIQAGLAPGSSVSELIRAMEREAGIELGPVDIQ